MANSSSSGTSSAGKPTAAAMWRSMMTTATSASSACAARSAAPTTAAASSGSDDTTASSSTSCWICSAATASTISGEGQDNQGLVVEPVDTAHPGDLAVGVEAGERYPGRGLLQVRPLLADALVAEDRPQRGAAEREHADRLPAVQRLAHVPARGVGGRQDLAGGHAEGTRHPPAVGGRAAEERDAGSEYRVAAAQDGLLVADHAVGEHEQGTVRATVGAVHRTGQLDAGLPLAAGHLLRDRAGDGEAGTADDRDRDRTVERTARPDLAVRGASEYRYLADNLADTLLHRGRVVGDGREDEYQLGVGADDGGPGGGRRGGVGVPLGRSPDAHPAGPVCGVEFVAHGRSRSAGRPPT